MSHFSHKVWPFSQSGILSLFDILSWWITCHIFSVYGNSSPVLYFVPVWHLVGANGRSQLFASLPDLTLVTVRHTVGSNITLSTHAHMHVVPHWDKMTQPDKISQQQKHGEIGNMLQRDKVWRGGIVKQTWKMPQLDNPSSEGWRSLRQVSQPWGGGGGGGKITRHQTLQWT